MIEGNLDFYKTLALKKISFDRKKKSGKVHISYGSIEELDLILRIFTDYYNIISTLSQLVMD